MPEGIKQDKKTTQKINIPKFQIKKVQEFQHGHCMVPCPTKKVRRNKSAEKMTFI